MMPTPLEFIGLVGHDSILSKIRARKQMLANTSFFPKEGYNELSTTSSRKQEIRNQNRH